MTTPQKIIFSLSLILSAVPLAINLFGFPYYENDEGIYVSQAWHSPYTYWYDHAPAGWMFLRVWLKSIGLFTFGTAINSGRVFMAFLHLASSALIYLIAFRLTRRSLPGVLALLLFGLSPLAIYFHRRVLLDNIATFWTLISLYLLLPKKLFLWPTLFSALAFGLAVLSKEVAIFFLPAFIFTLLAKSQTSNRIFIIGLWLTVSFLLISFYPLSAALKGELLPSPNLTHVSLIGTLREQLNRSFPNAFSDNWQRWLLKDSFLVYAGSAALVLSLFLSLFVSTLRIPSLFGACFAFFLLTSKLVIDFYIVPILPFIALCYGLLLNRLAFHPLVAAFFINLTLLAFLYSPFDYLWRAETAAQNQAIQYFKDQVPHDKNIVVEAWAYLDLKRAGFSSVDWSWKVEKDPEISIGKFHSDWRQIDYLLVSHEILRQIRDYRANFLKSALDHSSSLAMWTDSSTSYLDLPKYISTNGDWTAVYQIKNPAQIDLDDAWKAYKKKFIVGYGQVLDPQTNRTTSEGQAYALLRAVWSNDQTTFQGIWNWTRDHLQFRASDSLLSWLWEDDSLSDSASASDADIDTAMALLFASKLWQNTTYLAQAKAIISDIWTHEVIIQKGRYILVSGSNNLRVNPSYFSPGAYHLFAEVDPAHPWNQLAADSYKTLSELPIPPPDWLTENSPYGFDAFRVYWRVALDALWFDTPSAKNFLASSTPFFTSQPQIFAIYNSQGIPQVNYTSLSTSMGPLSMFTVTDPQAATRLYSQTLSGTWWRTDNYYDQNWGWFGFALYHHLLPNLWNN